jgi:hypothetical protein
VLIIGPGDDVHIRVRSWRAVSAESTETFEPFCSVVISAPGGTLSVKLPIPDRYLDLDAFELLLREAGASVTYE